MISKSDLKKINDCVWEIPKAFRGDMKVPARIFASEKLLEEIFRDRSLEQLINAAALPGIQKYALAMPDAHEGYGFPIGGVAAMDIEEGVISPGGIGYDINCGVRLLRSNLDFREAETRLEELAEEIFRTVPSGLGEGGKLKFSGRELDKVLKNGSKEILNRGFGEADDLEYSEANGRLEEAEPALVSDAAKSRGRDQVGTLGSGNHFLEIQRVDEIFNEPAAKIFGLFKDQLVVSIHTGSRGLGHQIATDYIRLMMKAMPRYGIILPDRELACVPFKSKEGRDYFKAMAAGANFAFANRQMLSYLTRQAFKKVFGNGFELKVVYDLAHNIAKIEEYEINGVKKKVITHRKGATRAFGPGNPELPEKYKKIGQPVLIPGSMGTASYVLAGTNESADLSFSTSCHGAGRRMSRHNALKIWRGKELREELFEKQGIIIKTASMRGIAEEAPLAYKDVEEVVNVVHNAGLAKKIARLKPLAVIKG